MRELQPGSLRDQIGIVAQDTFLFNDTVANNIAYGRARTCRTERSARRPRLRWRTSSSCACREGYETVIGERGVKLSRRAAAAALDRARAAEECAHPDSGRGHAHLDTESEMLVQKALANLMEHRTVIVIAHRLSTIRRADKIVVLEKGQIREIGTHEELIVARRNLSAAPRTAIRGCRIGGGPVSVRSMTGFARVRKEIPQGELVFSLKSVNHRGLDLHFHLPDDWIRWRTTSAP